jgi:hypothetical protein
MEVELQMSAKHIVNCVNAAPLKSTPISPLNRKPLSEYEFTYLISLSSDSPTLTTKEHKKEDTTAPSGIRNSPPKRVEKCKRVRRVHKDYAIM